MQKIKITYSKYPLAYDYYVTDDGRVWSEKTHKFLAFTKDKDGYLKVALRSTDTPTARHRYSVHRLVLENFNPVKNMELLQVNHIDGDKTNNCLTNLEWTTCSENIYHAIQNHLRSEINGSAKLTPEQVLEIYRRSWQGESNIQLANEFSVHPDTIGRIKNQKSWKDILNRSTTKSKIK